MKLHLLRHAKTEEKANSGQDFDRELKDRGKRQCADLNQHLKELNLGQLTVWCSTAQRTQETWQLIKSAVIIDQVELQHEIYLCDHTVFLKKIWDQLGNRDLMIVGHNFGLSDLASYFLGEEIVMKTSEFITIEFPFELWVEASKETGVIHHRYRSEAR